MISPFLTILHEYVFTTVIRSVHEHIRRYKASISIHLKCALRTCDLLCHYIIYMTLRDMKTHELM